VPLFTITTTSYAVLEPIPEPATLVLAALGIASLGGYVRRRRRGGHFALAPQ